MKRMIGMSIVSMYKPPNTPPFLMEQAMYEDFARMQLDA
jgi:hypothetical protein